MHTYVCSFFLVIVISYVVYHKKKAWSFRKVIRLIREQRPDSESLLSNTKHITLSGSWSRNDALGTYRIFVNPTNSTLLTAIIYHSALRLSKWFRLILSIYPKLMVSLLELSFLFNQTCRIVQIEKYVNNSSHNSWACHSIILYCLIRKWRILFQN